MKFGVSGIRLKLYKRLIAYCNIQTFLLRCKNNVVEKQHSGNCYSKAVV